VSSLCEAGLLFGAGAAAILLHRPLFFASLGPTAYELTETPERQSARPYNVIVGHLIGVLSGFLALAITGAWKAPPVSTSSITWVRLLAAAVATLLTTSVTLLVKSGQPAALATTVIVTTGSMQSPQDGLDIMLAIVLLTCMGEPLRRWRLNNRK
jgi:CBS domain-containing membrane protein